MEKPKWTLFLVTQLCPTLWDPTDCSMPGLPVLHHLLEPVQTHVEAAILQHTASFMVKLSHSYMTTGKTMALTIWTFVGKVMSLFFNTLSRLAIPFLPRSKCLLISGLQSPSAVILETQKINSHCFHCFPIYLPCSDGTGCHDLRFWMLSFKPAFSLSSFTFIKKLFSSSSLRWCHQHIWGYWYFSWQSWFHLVLPPAQCFSWCTLHISSISRVTI